MGIIGRACCRECGGIVIGEVERNIQCPKCGRVFQIPNQPEYVAPVARLLWRHSRIISRNVSGVEVGLSFPTLSLEIEIHEYGGEVLVVAEFPGHWEIREIQHRREGNRLIFKSLTCPSYQGEVILPDWAREPDRISLENCIFSMRFCREPPL